MYNFVEIFNIIRNRIWTVVGIVALGSVASVTIALYLPDEYRAEVLLAPNTAQGTSGYSGLAAQYGGLASLAGIDLDAGGKEKTNLGLEILQSRQFVASFIHKFDLAVPLIAAKRWDDKTQRLTIDNDVYDSTAGRWVREVKPPQKVVPSNQELYEKFHDDVLTVVEDQNTGFIKLRIRHYSPILAREWANSIVSELNHHIMRKDVDEAEQAIAYLRGQIESTSLTEMRTVFSRMIEEQTKTVMLARVSDQYLFRIVDPAVAPEKKYAPNRPLICVLGAILSMLLALTIVVGADAFGRRN